MKAYLVFDELNQFHWTMLKVVVFILSLLPFSHIAFSVWQMADDSSQIMVGFMMLSLASAWFLLCFFSALKTSVYQMQNLLSRYEQMMFKLYRCVPMLLLSGLTAYLATQISMRL